MQQIPTAVPVPIPQDTTVLVTGGSGYLGTWTIATLLQHGYRVRTTLRDLSRESAVRAAVEKVSAAEGRLSFYAADLLSEAGWDAAVSGCDSVQHISSPMGQGMPKNTDLVSPAREGTLQVLRASARAGVRRVVVTSSTIAAQPPTQDGSTGQPLWDETAWTDPAQKGLSEYGKSKTLAERAAWKFMQDSSTSMTLATILPGMILGPVLAGSVAGSVEVVSRMLAGKVPALPRIGFSIVDVRDVADLHLRAMVSPLAAGQRFLAATDFLWLSDIARLLREHFGDRAAKVPTRRLPDVVLRVAALFQREAAFMVPMLGIRTGYNSAKAKELLNWQPRTATDSVLECAESLLHNHLV